MKTGIIVLFVSTMAFVITGCPAKITQTDNNKGDAAGALGETKRQNGDSKKIVKTTPKESKSDTKPDSEKNKESEGNKIKSVYTDLAANKCKTVTANEQEESSLQICNGVAGYKLEVIEGDIRQTINIVSPNGKKHELNLWSVVSPAFSSVGKKAEWRVITENGKTKPIALIVRYNASENPDDSAKITSYLTVSKITEGATCVTDVVKPIKNANVKARKLADASAEKPCKTRSK